MLDAQVREFLSENLITSHIQLLLEFYGVSSMQDLCEFEEEDIKKIEDLVRDGTLSRHKDLDSSDNRRAYLGFDYNDLKSFSLRPIDRKRLMLLNFKAKAKRNN